MYQGSSGRVYPLPFIERIADEPTPCLAGRASRERVAAADDPARTRRPDPRRLDKTTGYDFFYRNNVIKPALVGLAGPWISGGVEFNWPQHHRPATFLPIDVDDRATRPTARSPSGAPTTTRSPG